MIRTITERTASGAITLTHIERVSLEASRQYRWASDQVALHERNPQTTAESLAFLRGFRDAMSAVSDYCDQLKRTEGEETAREHEA